MKSNSIRKKRVVMATIGSLGDLHPYLSLALEMKRRNIEPVVATSQSYRQRVESLGIEFKAIRPTLPEAETPEYQKMIDGVVDPNRGAEYLFKKILAPSVREMYRDLRSATRRADLLVTHPIVLAGPLLAQKTSMPWISTALAPASLWSAFDPWIPPNAPWIHSITAASPFVARAYLKLVKALTNTWFRELYRLRNELSLTSGEHPLFEGQFAPECNLALFSNVMCEPQSDWPANTAITGFPFFDKKEDTPPDVDLLRFLGKGPAPIVFTLGSSAIHVAGDFYRESIAAAKLLKHRAVLLIGSDRNRPKHPLPEDIIAVRYAPFGELLPRAAAMVHQGGVGTTGQGLRAGIPMLVVPFAHDQHDNGARVERLGVARTLARKDYKADRIAAELRELLRNPFHGRCARETGNRVRAENGAARAVSLILDRLNQRSNERFRLRTVA